MSIATIHIVFFASIREAVGLGEMELDCAGLTDVGSVLKQLVAVGGAFERALTTEHLLVAVNQSMVELSHAVHAGDEVAFFPPVTGG